MSKDADLRRLNRSTLPTRLIAGLVLVGGLLALALYADPVWVGVDPRQAAAYRGAWPWLAAGTLFTVGGAAFLYAAGERARRLKRLLRTQPPEAMELEIERVEAGPEKGTYARLYPPEESMGWRAALWLARDAAGEQAGERTPALVYFDPRTNLPAVIEYPGGLLWVMPGPDTARKMPVRAGRTREA